MVQGQDLGNQALTKDDLFSMATTLQLNRSVMLQHFSAMTVLMSFVLSTVAGCSSGGTGDKRPQGTVSGKVTLSGQPVTGGAIHLTSVKVASESYGAELTAQGEYSVASSIPVGSYKVSLSPPEMGPSAGPGGTVAPADPKSMQNMIPPKYRSAEKSDKTVEVKAGSNTLPIDLVP